MVTINFQGKDRDMRKTVAIFAMIFMVAMIVSPVTARNAPPKPEPVDNEQIVIITQYPGDHTGPVITEYPGDHRGGDGDGGPPLKKGKNKKKAIPWWWVWPWWF
jgi:hypothetical protein